jgi:hypothetical protein
VNVLLSDQGCSNVTSQVYKSLYQIKYAASIRSDHFYIPVGTTYYIHSAIHLGSANTLDRNCPSDNSALVKALDRLNRPWRLSSVGKQTVLSNAIVIVRGVARTWSVGIDAHGCQYITRCTTEHDHGLSCTYRRQFIFLCGPGVEHVIRNLDRKDLVGIQAKADRLVQLLGL